MTGPFSIQEVMSAQEGVVAAVLYTAGRVGQDSAVVPHRNTGARATYPIQIVGSGQGHSRPGNAAVWAMVQDEVPLRRAAARSRRLRLYS